MDLSNYRAAKSKGAANVAVVAGQIVVVKNTYDTITGEATPTSVFVSLKDLEQSREQLCARHAAELAEIDELINDVKGAVAANPEISKTEIEK